MLTPAASTIHASCVLVGRSAVLIRGDSGSGKSSLALALIEASRAGKIPPAWLVADDRVLLSNANGRLLASAPESIAGKIEIRGLGIHDTDCERLALVSLVVDLGAKDAARMPEEVATFVELMGVKLSRLPVSSQKDAVPALIAAFSPVTKS